MTQSHAGAGNIATGYLLSKLTGECYTWGDTLRDGAIGAAGGFLATFQKIRKLNKLEKSAKVEIAKTGETAATKAGRQAHKDWNPGEGFDKEVTLPSGKRADAVNFKQKHVKELKPDNPRAMKRGEKQVEQYRQEL